MTTPWHWLVAFAGGGGLVLLILEPRAVVGVGVLLMLARRGNRYLRRASRIGGDAELDERARERVRRER